MLNFVLFHKGVDQGLIATISNIPSESENNSHIQDFSDIFTKAIERYFDCSNLLFEINESVFELSGYKKHITVSFYESETDSIRIETIELIYTWIY